MRPAGEHFPAGNAAATLTILASRAFVGPNVWFGQPVIQTTIRVENVGTPDSVDESRIARIVAEIVGGQPALTDLLSFRASDPGSLLSAVAALAIAIQKQSGQTVGFSAIEPAGDLLCYEVAVEVEQVAIGEAAIDLAARLVELACSGREIDETRAREASNRFRSTVERFSWGDSAKPVVDAARRRGIPVQLADAGRTLVDLGTGRYRQRILRMTTSRTSHTGIRIAKSKILNDALLRRAGIPVPESIVVSSIDEAVQASHQIGFPVVVKPVDGNRARGVSIELDSDAMVRAAFPAAAQVSSTHKALIQPFIQGTLYRVLVIDNKISSVLERVPAHIVGDGQRTIQRLIEETNADRRAHQGTHRAPGDLLADQQTFSTLERQGLTLDDVPAAGQVVKLRMIGPGAGGASVACTGQIHPDNAAIALQAAKVVGIDIAGIDLVTPDITRSMLDDGGAIIEVNTGPRFTGHFNPHGGEAVDIGEHIVDMLFPRGQSVRAPVVAVSGEGAGPICEFIAQLLAHNGKAVGLATKERVVIDGVHLRHAETAGLIGVHTVLNNPAVEIAVAEVEPRDTAEFGLGFDYCDVVVLTSRDDGPASGLRTPATVLLETCVAGGTVVLPADQPELLEMSRGKVDELLLFGSGPRNEALENHLQTGGRAVLLGEQESIDLFEDGVATALHALDQVAGETSLAHAGRVLAAVASAVALNVPIDTIRRALVTDRGS